jgi:hypothetical protein
MIGKYKQIYTSSIFNIKKYFFLTVVAIVAVVELKKEKCVLGPGASLKYYY